MRILIFGASGYIGSEIAYRLVQAGHQVTAVVRSEGSEQKAARTGATTHYKELENTDEMAALLLEHDASIYAAQLMLAEEHNFIQFVLQTLEDTGKIFVFTSGTSLLSERTNGDWIDTSYSEYDAFIPRRQLAPRLAIENMVREYARRGVKAMCIRPSLVWGKGGSQVIQLSLIHI